MFTDNLMRTIKILKASKRNVTGKNFTVSYFVPEGKYSIIYIARGKGNAALNNSRHRIADGDFLLCEGGDFLSYRFAESSNSLVYFTEFTVEEGIDFKKCFKLPCGVHHCSSFDNMAELFEELIKEFIRKAPLWEINTSAILCRLLCLLSSAQAENSAVTDAIYKLAEDIHDSFTEGDIDVEKYASSVNLSKDRLSVIFKQHFKNPPYKYQLLLKMEEASYLLSNTNLSVAEISQMLGFSNPAYFSSAYKKQTGISPTEARKNKYNSTID